MFVSVIDENSGRSVESHALFCICDISEESSVASCIASTIEKFSGLDALVNNAALASPWIGEPDDHQMPFDALPVANFRRFVEVNLLGSYICSHYAAPHLRALQSETNKAGLIGLTQAMTVSFLGAGVRVNAVSPGWIDGRDTESRQSAPLTEIDHSQHPAGRVGVPDDVTKMVEFLVDDLNGFITGQNFVIDGGMKKKMIYHEFDP